MRRVPSICERVLAAASAPTKTRGASDESRWYLIGCSGVLHFAVGQKSRWLGRESYKLVSFIRSTNRPKEAIMKQSSKDQAEGTLHEVKGKVKEKVGRATNNPNLEDEGTDEKVSGKVQKKVGQVERVFEK